MEIISLMLGDYQTNCYVVWQDKKCCIIDPGYEAGQILSAINARGLEVEAILLTHGHFDHVGAVGDIAAETDCQVYLGAADMFLSLAKKPFFFSGVSSGPLSPLTPVM